jgi:ribonuclease P protein component
MVSEKECLQATVARSLPDAEQREERVYLTDITALRSPLCDLSLFAEETICENRDFRRLYSSGKSIVTSRVVIYYRKNRFGSTRVGITTSKKIGNAVMRNRSRRIIREAVRQLLPELKKGYDLILVARGRTPFLKSTDIYEVLKTQCGKNGLLLKAENRTVS